MPGLIGKKIGMTSLFDTNGKNIACTVIQAGPCTVTQVKTQETDGYEAIQLGFGDRKEKNTPAPLKGHFKKAGATALHKVAEMHGFEKELKPGDQVTVDIFSEGDWVEVIGTSKGKGFQGVVKRYGFRGVGGRTHGQHDRERAPGSMGAGSTPSRVFKGKRLPGRMGGNRVMIENLQVLKVYPEQNLLVISGAVPGAKGSYVIVEK